MSLYKHLSLAETELLYQLNDISYIKLKKRQREIKLDYRSLLRTYKTGTNLKVLTKNFSGYFLLQIYS